MKKIKDISIATIALALAGFVVVNLGLALLITGTLLAAFIIMIGMLAGIGSLALSIALAIESHKYIAKSEKWNTIFILVLVGMFIPIVGLIGAGMALSAANKVLKTQEAK